MSPPGIAFIRSIFHHILLYQRHIKLVSVLVIANSLASAAGWFTQIMIANILGKELFGRVAFATSIGIFGQVFVRVGLDRTLVRDLVHYPDRFEEFVEASLYLRYLLALVLLFGLLLWKVMSPVSAVSWGEAMIIMGSSVLSLDLQPVYDVWGKMQRHVIYFLSQKILYLLLIWSAFYFLKDNFSIFLIGAAAISSALFYLIIQHQWALKEMRFKSHQSFRMIAAAVKWLLRENWLIWISALLGLAVIQINQLALKKYCGYAELGLYAAAWQFVIIGTILIDQISRVGRPAMARITMPGASGEVKRLFLYRYIAVMVGIITPPALMMVLLRNSIFKVLFKPEYGAAANILPMLSAYLLLLSIGMVFSQYILSVRLERLYFYSIMIGSILSYVLSHVFIPQYGIVGATWVLLLSHGASILCYIAGALFLTKSESAIHP